jgi:hypothetical protein
MTNDSIKLNSVYTFSLSTTSTSLVILWINSSNLPHDQMIVQGLPFPTTNKPNVHVIRRYHKHLHDGTKTDAVSGWLIYASFGGTSKFSSWTSSFSSWGISVDFVTYNTLVIVASLIFSFSVIVEQPYMTVQRQMLSVDGWYMPHFTMYSVSTMQR